MDKKEEFHTLKGYELSEDNEITSSMEDYLEMICRLLKTEEYVRISVLAEKLNVKPSSASKMVNNLKMLGLVTFEKYGYIKLTEKGAVIGEYLLYRHEVIHEFLCLVNNSESELEQVEKIEHFLNKKTIDNLKRITGKIKKEL
ncbi:MAG TPA: iron dependent repressor, metal binding and dimerization domain protein [Bacillota bacterium]|nr:iron dependent repressor, metal binding and dimerization domain protein [Bacillota bacterium]HOK69102.1 iron dependent repressor, metal binding and dimerization domain protein [Bacillota bacterium]HPP85566.1 iron dependent repressor, metal binding and dimerization domain protein [Bacillota bacterium]